LGAGPHSLTVQPVSRDWKPMNVRWLKLTPASARTK
jgi:hypothetical protein